MKFLIILFLLVNSVFGVSINNSLLKIHATLIPKICLMDYAHKEKIKNNEIVIAIVYNQINYKSAKNLKNIIDTKYVSGIKSYVLKTKLVLYSRVDKSDANIYYMLPTTSYNIKKTIEKASQSNALTFAYLQSDLKYGVMLSVDIGSKVKPILNLNAIKLQNISFRPILLKISNIYLKISFNFLDKIQYIKVVV